MTAVRTRLFGFLLAFLFAACVPKHHVIVRGSGLAIGAPLSAIDDGPFRLLFGGPQGPSTTGTDVTLAFSRSVRDTTDAPAKVVRDDDGRNVEGTWQWIGDSTAVFHPQTRFAAATTYRVEPRLENAPPFTFTTERPKLERVVYEYDEAKNAHLVALTFDHDVSARAATEAIRIEGRATPSGPAKTIAFKVIEESRGHTLTVQTDVALARLEGVVVIATTALRGVEGPLGPTEETRLPLEGIGPFKVELRCNGEEPKAKCNADTSIGLDLTRYVNEGDFLRHLVIGPPGKADPAEMKAIRDRGLSDQIGSFDLGSLLGIEPGHHYRVTVKAGLLGNDKERLASDQVIDIETADRPASLHWRDLSGGAPNVWAVESARQALSLSVFATNVSAFDVISAPLDEHQVADFFFPRAGSLRDAAWVRGLPMSKTSAVEVQAAKNESAEKKVDVAKDRAAYVVATHAPGLEDNVQLLSMTDLGVHTKWSPHGALVWVTQLSTAEPVAGATISLGAFSTTTDREGIATIPAEVVTPSALLFVKKAADSTFVRLPELDASLMTANGYIFAERGLYRPGESVLAKGYFRMPTPRGLVSPAGKTIYLEAVDGADHVFHAQTAILDAFGAFSAEIAIPKNARLGSALLRARVGTTAPTPTPGRRGSTYYWPAQTRFRIDAFRAPEFKVEAKANRESFVRGETATITATGTYLLGTPMTNVPVNVEVSRRRTRFTPPGLEAFSVTGAPFLANSDPMPSRSEVASKLDGSGRTTVTFPFPSSTAAADPESYAFEVDIRDVSEAFAITDVATVTVHPSNVYLGIKANEGPPPLIPGKTVRAEIVAAAIDGTRRDGLAARVELFRSSAKGEPIATGRSCSVTTNSTKVATCDLGVTDEGAHWLKASAVDASGRALIAADRFVVLPKNTKPPPPKPKEVPAPPALSFEEECRIPWKQTWIDELMLEGRSEPYRAGQNALGCLRSVEPSTQKVRGLFTIEREGILRRDALVDFAASNAKLVKVPITDDLYPNASLAFTEVVGRTSSFPTSNREDSGHPRYVNGSRQINVAAPATKLSVTIETEKEARPGAEVELRLLVKDGEGRPAGAQVTLWAIDEGIHMLMPRGVPMPEETFGERRDSDVIDLDTRKNIYFEHAGSHQTKSPSLRMGATSVSDRTLVGRSVFRPTAFFFTNLITGANGAATVKAKLPDSLTTWKVFAVAANPTDGFGEGETSFATNKPLMLRPLLPRFLRIGDRFDATVIVDSMMKEPLEVVLAASASGVLAASGSPTVVTIPPDGHVPVHFSIEAKAVGSGKLVFDVKTTKGPPLHDEVTIDEDVSSIASMETVVVAGELPSSKARTTVNEAVGDLSKVRPDVGGFDYRLSTTPLVGLASSLGGLLEYPYGCTEQLTSRLVPLIRLREMARDLGVELPANVDAAVRSSLASLLSHQRTDGGFGVWRESRKSEAWLTLLALDALHAAEKHGYVVPASSVDLARKWLEKPPDALDLGARAMLEDLFASMGKPRAAELRALAAEPTLPLFAQALTAHALAAVDRDLAKQLLDRIASHAQVSGASVTFVDDTRTHLSSNGRTTAMVLRALLAIEPKDPIVAKTVRGLLSLRHDGRWQTTQDSAWALAALEDARVLYRPTPGRSTAEFLFDRHEVAKTSFSGSLGGETRTGTLSMSRLLSAPGSSVSFESDGERALYYEGALRYARIDPPSSPLDRGITVARGLRPLSAQSSTTSGFHVGDYVVAEVALATTTPRDLIVLDDPIPAGFEAVNVSFAALDQSAPLVVDPARALTHRELHDDRVLSFFDSLPAGIERTSYVLRVIAAGRFALPPAKAECMYAPDVFGRTASAWVETR